MPNLLVLPLLVPLLGAIILFFMHGHSLVAAVISCCVSVLQVIVASILLWHVWSGVTIVLDLAGWSAPFGISLVGDLFSCLMLFAASIVGVAVTLFALFDAPRSEAGALSCALFQLMMMGVSGAFLTGDLFNLYVWFEVMLISSFVLLSMGTSKASFGGAFKYVLLNLFSSLLFLTGLGLLYGQVGSLNFAHLSLRTDVLWHTLPSSGSAVLLFCAFAIKSALFPMHFWLPASYHHASSWLAAAFGGLLSKVGVYALIRTFTLVYPLGGSWLQQVILYVSLASMIIGVLQAAAQMNFQRVLSFHIVSQIGYMTLGLALYSTGAIAAAVFYILHNMIAKTNMYLLGGVAKVVCGSSDLGKQGGLFASHLFISLLFLVSAFSLAGLPPLSGFFAKLLLLSSAIEVRAWGALVVALLVGVGTLFSMSKIWAEAFWKPLVLVDEEFRGGGATFKFGIAGIALLAFVSIAMGLGSSLLYEACQRVSFELLNPDSYQKAVLGQGVVR